MRASRQLYLVCAATAFATLTACASAPAAMDQTPVPSPTAAADGGGSSSTASTPAAASSSTAAASGAKSRNKAVLNVADIESAGGVSMAEVVQRVRPQWLQAGGARSLGATSSALAIMVYVDGQRYGDVSQLKNIAPTAVREARYLSAQEAQSRYGLKNGGPVISITSR